jgi:4-methyl-5(b-hydroxyethyl)-thiazole monophosphate biosynthesis
MPRVIVPLAQGFEEIEAVTVIDLLRRAQIDVLTAGLDARRVAGSHDIVVEADVLLAEAIHELYDMVVLPGGMPGAQHLREDPRVIELIRRHVTGRRYAAAICAAPSVLAAAGVLRAGGSATSFPGFLDERSAPDVRLSTAPVVIDGLIVTSRGPGTAIDFSLALIELLSGRGARDAVESRLQRT